MVLVAEGLRDAGVEKPIAHDTTTYSANWETSGVWQDLKSYTFTLASDSYVHFRFRCQYYHTSGSSSTSIQYGARIKEGTAPVIAYAQALPHSYSGSSTNVPCEGHGLVRLASGSHTVTLQGWCYSTSDAPTTAYTRITVTSFGICSISDTSYYYDLETAGVSCTGGAYTTVLSASITAPTSNRNTVLGQMKSDKYTVFIFASVNPANTFRNSGDSTNGWYIYKDGAKIDWTDREPTHSWYGTTTAVGICSYLASAGDSDSIEIKYYPASNSTAYGTLAVLICPWIIHDSSGHFPVTLEAPVGSTIKLTLEPFNGMDYCFETAASYGFRMSEYTGVVGNWIYSLTGTGGTRCDVSFSFTGPQTEDLTVVEAYGKLCIISYIALDTA